MTVSDIAMLADGALILRVDERLRGTIEPWIPRHVRAASSAQSDLADSVTRGGVAERSVALMVVAPESDSDSVAPSNERHRTPASPPTLSLGGVDGYVDGDNVTLAGRSDVRGTIDLAAQRARLTLGTNVSTAEVHGALTLTAALLIGRIGRALIHAAAVVDLDGRGRLLVGDSHSGKTTTCATLSSAGWQFVADDQVVMSAGADGLTVEGWPREAHLDSGWHEGRVTHHRVPSDLNALRGDAWTPRTVVRGVWFPSVAPNDPTSLVSIGSADALVRLVRQSPWLLADAAIAANTLALLSRLASTQCAALSLGIDSYANGELLVRRLSADIA